MLFPVTKGLQAFAEQQWGIFLVYVALNGDLASRVVLHGPVEVLMKVLSFLFVLCSSKHLSIHLCGIVCHRFFLFSIQAVHRFGPSDLTVLGDLLCLTVAGSLAPLVLRPILL